MCNVYFHHFHKAAGSSAVELLARDYQLPKNHANGNPLDENGMPELFWEYDGATLDDYLKTRQRAGVTLLVSEWGIANVRRLKSKGFKTAVIVREPVERIVSNYVFDRNNKHFPYSFAQYVRNPAISYQRGDYYSYEIKRACLAHAVGPSRYETEDLAETFLNWFDEVVLLEAGVFYKVKNSDIFDLSQLPKKNQRRQSSHAFFEWLKKPNRDEGLVDAARSVSRADQQLYSLFRSGVEFMADY